MNKIITEKDYPVSWIWVYRTPLIISIFYSYFIILSIQYGGDLTSEKFKLFLFVILILAIFTINILKKINFHYSIEEKFLILQQGILNKQKRYIPYGVVQNVFVRQNLLDRVFGLALLIIENASWGSGNVKIPEHKLEKMVGFSKNIVVIPGLKKAHAEKLRDIILQKIKENPIEDSQSGL